MLFTGGLCKPSTDSGSPCLNTAGPRGRSHAPRQEFPLPVPLCTVPSVGSWEDVFDSSHPRQPHLHFLNLLFAASRDRLSYFLRSFFKREIWVEHFLKCCLRENVTVAFTWERCNNLKRGNITLSTWYPPCGAGPAPWRTAWCCLTSTRQPFPPAWWGGCSYLYSFKNLPVYVSGSKERIPLRILKTFPSKRTRHCPFSSDCFGPCKNMT